MGGPQRVQRTTTRAAAALLVYGGISGLVGDWFPFTRVPMYAGLGQEERREAAIPLVLRAGERVDVQAFHRFAGPPAQDIEPWARCRELGPCQAFPSSDPRATRFADWVRTHPASADDPPGPVELEIGYLMVRPTGVGTYDQHFEPVWRGTAWPRR